MNPGLSAFAAHEQDAVPPPAAFPTLPPPYYGEIGAKGAEGGQSGPPGGEGKGRGGAGLGHHLEGSRESAFTERAVGVTL